MKTKGREKRRKEIEDGEYGEEEKEGREQGKLKTTSIKEEE